MNWEVIEKFTELKSEAVSILTIPFGKQEGLCGLLRFAVSSRGISGRPMLHLSLNLQLKIFCEMFQEGLKFKPPRQLRRAPADPSLLRFSWRNTQTAGAGSTNTRSADRNLLNPSLFKYAGDPHPTSRCRMFWGRPDTSHRIPIILWIFDYLSTIHSPFDTYTKLSNHLRAGLSLHVAPWFLHSTGSNAVRDHRRLSQHRDTEVRKRNSSEWSAGSWRNPARKAEHHALHPQWSSQSPYWWQTPKRKSRAHDQSELSAATPAIKTIYSWHLL